MLKKNIVNNYNQDIENIYNLLDNINENKNSQLNNDFIQKQ